MDKRIGISAHSDPASDASGERLHQLEMAVQRAQEGLARWQAHCFEQVSSVPLSGAEITLLLLIGSGGRSKSIKELARFTNRVDIPNIQYSLRKLASAGLTCKKGAGRSGVSYSLTKEGTRVAGKMKSVREHLLLEALADRPGLASLMEGAQEVLEELTELYDTNAHTAGAGSKP